MTTYKDKQSDIWAYMTHVSPPFQVFIVKRINPKNKDTIHEVRYNYLTDRCECDCEWGKIYGDRRKEWLNCSHVVEVRKKLKTIKEDDK